jgi:hypothetical protein
MSALPPKADMCSALAHVRFGPIADMRPFARLKIERPPMKRPQLTNNTLNALSERIVDHHYRHVHIGVPLHH